MISTVKKAFSPEPERKQVIPTFVVKECSSCEKSVEIGILKEMESRYGKPVCPFCFQDPKGDEK